MFGKFSYIVLLIPILLVDVFLVVCFLKTLIKYKKTLTAVVLFFIFWYFVVDPLAVSVLHIWGYGSDKILGIWITGTVIEELIWMILAIFLFSAASIVFIDKKLKKR